MSKPQSSERRRSDKGATTPQEAAPAKVEDRRQGPGGPARAHGTDRGDKGGGEGGGTPPDQRPEHP